MNALLLLAFLTPPAPQAGNPPACEALAHAARTAAIHDAHSGFWIAVAHLANEPHPDRRGALDDLREERDEAVALAETQFRARLRACALLGHGMYHPDVKPSEFSADLPGGWFPLAPGATYVWERRGAGGVERIVSTVQDAPVEIAGFPCRGVDTVETIDGALKERTTDWYSLRADGSVWYFGEISQEYEAGFLASIEGSWRAGQDGGKPGMILTAAPALGEVYRMEFLVGSAEDLGRVVGTDETVTVPAGTFDHCVAVEEWSPIEPADLVVKYYAPQVGMVLEVDATTGERLELLERR